MDCNHNFSMKPHQLTERCPYIKTIILIRFISSHPWAGWVVRVFWRQKCKQNANGVTPDGGSKYRWVDSNGDFQQISRYITETVQDRDIVTMER